MKIVLILLTLLFPTIISANTVELTWVAPSEREDNTTLSLSDIFGYRIYYGTSSGNYNTSISIDDSAAIGYSITLSADGTYYFVVTTRDTDGRESQYSSEIIVPFTGTPEPEPEPIIAAPKTVQEYTLSQGVVQ